MPAKPDPLTALGLRLPRFVIRGMLGGPQARGLEIEIDRMVLNDDVIADLEVEFLHLDLAEQGLQFVLVVPQQVKSGSLVRVDDPRKSGPRSMIFSNTLPASAASNKVSEKDAADGIGAVEQVAVTYLALGKDLSQIFFTASSAATPLIDDQGNSVGAGARLLPLGLGIDIDPPGLVLLALVWVAHEPLARSD